MNKKKLFNVRMFARIHWAEFISKDRENKELSDNLETHKHRWRDRKNVFINYQMDRCCKSFVQGMDWHSEEDDTPPYHQDSSAKIISSSKVSSDTRRNYRRSWGKSKGIIRRHHRCRRLLPEVTCWHVHLVQNDRSWWWRLILRNSQRDHLAATSYPEYSSSSLPFQSSVDSYYPHWTIGDPFYRSKLFFRELSFVEKTSYPIFEWSFISRFSKRWFNDEFRSPDCNGLFINGGGGGAVGRLVIFKLLAEVEVEVGWRISSKKFATKR